MQHLNSYVCWEAKNGNRKQNQKKNQNKLIEEIPLFKQFFKIQMRWSSGSMKEEAACTRVHSSLHFLCKIGHHVQIIEIAGPP